MGKTGRRNEGSQNLEIDKHWKCLEKKKKAVLQEHKAPGGHSRNMSLKSWIEPMGQTV